MACQPFVIRTTSYRHFAKRTSRLDCQQRKPRLQHRNACICSQRDEDYSVDVAVIGSGIIGLAISHVLLRLEGHRVALIDASNNLFSGATGAGQGYIWLAHRDPQSPAWELAWRSKELWRELTSPAGPLQDCYWQAKGSVLLATDSAEAEALRARAALLNASGIQAEVLEPAQAVSLEPALRLPSDGAAVLVGSDAQLDGRQAALRLLSECQSLGKKPGNEFHALFGEAVESLCEDSGGRVTGVRTSSGVTVRASRGTVVAAGAWTGRLLSEWLGDERWERAIGPRFGQLLELKPPPGMAELRSGLMESCYAKHYAEPSLARGPRHVPEGGCDITFTATTGAAGELLVGSSREFSGDDPTRLEVSARILERAAQFLPSLEGAAAAAQRAAKAGETQWIGGAVRAGPRPWAARGLPHIGPVEGRRGLYIAAGHEGSGLTLAPVTAEMMLGHLTGTRPSLSAEAIESLRPGRR
uniref:FAD-dependent oxidoreductase domain-containing protein 1 n=1 Tax=Tetraselmis sp. GSL018 TaxID=582737 RepID=A0A061SKG1_9CHLO|mmetsp:Transcript_1096/g.2623  ORF Transcript_1096/g.2623 Transcript_1096/m.2623 type:complete len:471 (-) Transcript_1096:142-1554(-)